MGRVLLLTLAGLGGVACLLVAVVVLSFRLRIGPVVDLIRRINRSVANPRQLRRAGQPGAYGVVHHVGRRSGRRYDTPVGIVPTDEGILVLLPYGAGADWVRNVLAAGGATISHDGESFEVTAPRIVDRDAIVDHLSPGDRRVTTLFAMADYLVARRVGGAASGT